ncbi:ornithine carbamoyltransferase [Ignicoccus islandicus DSM 13165]|uniref:Ornithine carbamoyltransferase n=1 Tax=Ignicoccus islandicus DSM 13165 TaxID=940295 RepID=A0A0U3FN78_9CREN|nr:ornithine carbamoyltransferase [Ignicoccus islandicus]ALU11791.1 ornithine carbamoyltransferase [Ignicoccus islandicus DSM 13165]
MKLKGRNLLSLMDFEPWEIRYLLSLSLSMKEEYLLGKRYWGYLENRYLALIFEKPSTRTRVAFEVAAKQLGMHPIFISKENSHLGRGEPVKDTARALSQYVDAIAARVLKHETLIELSKYFDGVVVNALSDKFHPTQALADAMTIYEKLGKVEGVRVVFIGDGRDNVAHSLILALTSLGANVRVVTAPGYEPLDEVLFEAMERARRSGGSMEIVYDPCKGVAGADVIYTDVWVSMGFESEADKRKRDLAPYQVNKELTKCIGKDFLFMHCLPAVRGEEVTEEVIESDVSIVWDQAENKLHAQRAVLSALVP